MIYALLDRAENAYFRFYVRHPKEPRDRVYAFDIFRCKYNAVTQQITSNVAQLSDAFPINFFII